MYRSKWFVIGVGALTLIALTAGLSAFSFFSPVSASAEVVQPVREAVYFGPGRPGSPGGPGKTRQYLAEALGITEEALQAAEDAAFQAAVEEALQNGLITQAQVDRLNEPNAFKHRGLSELLVGPESGIDMEEFLAVALGITIEELQTAKEQAFEDALTAQVEEGNITEEQADLIKAKNALRGYLDPEAMMAKALGITEEQLESYRTQHLRPDEIAEDLGLTIDQLNEAIPAAYMSEVEQAVEDGVITQDQADLLLENQDYGPHFGQFGRDGFGGGPGRMMPGMRGEFSDPEQPPQPPAQTEESNS
jgi:hypothetical protein